MFENELKKKPKTDIKFNIQLNEEQKQAKEGILNKAVSFIHGKPGSGKTLLGVQIALDLLFNKKIEKIVITRPTISTEDNGFLPGSLEEKLEPWLVPIRDNMRKVYNKPDQLQKLEQEHKIEIVSLTHFRGRTFDNAVCIIDEYQNLTKEQLKMAIGRLGKESKMIFCGDNSQIDLKRKTESAIHEIPKLQNCKFVFIKELLENHRHEAVIEILRLLD